MTLATATAQDRPLHTRTFGAPSYMTPSAETRRRSCADPAAISSLQNGVQWIAETAAVSRERAAGTEWGHIWGHRTHVLGAISCMFHWLVSSFESVSEQITDCRCWSFLFVREKRPLPKHVASSV